MNRYLKLLAMLVFIAFAFSAGCGKKIVKEEIGESASAGQQAAADKDAVAVPDQKPLGEGVTSQELSPEAQAALESGAPGAAELAKMAKESGELYTVHFDYDKYNIREEDRELLGKNAGWLKLNRPMKIRIEGYADERGETEYNLALGDKRAKSVEKYLRDMGVSTDRLSTISYGEENPVDNGHDEGAWAKNRRAEFKVAD